MGRDNVRRISPGSKRDRELPENKIQWRRSQEHYELFKALVKWELDDELQLMQKRWKTWTNNRLSEAGLSLFNLLAKPNGRFFGDPIISFSAQSGSNLPWHGFRHGDIVILSRSRPMEERCDEGIVLDRNRKRIRVVFKERPEALRKGVWRIDKGANRVAHDRMQNALDAFHSDDSEMGTPLRDIIMARVHDIEAAASQTPDIGGLKKQIDRINLSKYPLNDSQREAVELSLKSKVSIIQGPPGTGKTHTAVQLVRTWVKRGMGPILVCAESNVAVDNLLNGLLENEVMAVRLGQPVKVRENLRSATMDAHIAKHPDQEKVKMEKDYLEEVQNELKNLKGREKGLAHRDLNKGWKEVKRLEKKMAEDVLDGADVICATCIGSGHEMLGYRRFPFVLIDEATQSSEPSTLVPVVRGARQVVLVGDHRQLPPTVISRRAEEGGLNRSLFERLIEAGLPAHMLEMQYRMHPTIRDFPSGRFYEGRLEDGESAKQRTAPAGINWPDWENPVAFVPIEGAEIVDEMGSSRSNMDEAGCVVELVKGVLDAMELQASDIGVISPYAGQVRLLNDLFEDAGGLAEGERFHGLEVKTVDGYQGREKELIIMSTVRSNSEGVVGFLKDRRRLNVAMTRAKRGLVVVGDSRTLRHDPTWASWLDWVDEKGLMAWHLKA
ncbi:MAG TPA: hypothetical protein EYQ85_03035 [Candidatus Poseidoniales archaeon]|jgi:regulator of nonsense transcripts 1|nr:MAG: hypothetical protein CXT68_05080 [Euryarchaeota archaeon]HIF16209.1 hypothetical protein [Candidatus Poseidoniales archaeon]